VGHEEAGGAKGLACTESTQKLAFSPFLS
jgi:hypothetical protein